MSITEIEDVPYTPKPTRKWGVAFAKVAKDFNFSHTYEVSSALIDQLGIKVKVHTADPLTEYTQEYVDRTLEATTNTFHASFPFSEYKSDDYNKEVDIYLFENKSALSRALSTVGENPKAGGVTWADSGIIYIAKEGKNHAQNLPHEFTHYLFYYAVAGNANPFLWNGGKVIKEGISDYIQHKVQHESDGEYLEFMATSEHVMKVLREDPEFKNLSSLSDVADAIFNRKNNPVCYGLEYNLGMTLVAYLQDRNPKLLSTLLAETHHAALHARGAEIIKDGAALKLQNTVSLQDLTISEDFKNWLKEHSIANFVDKHDLLKVHPGYKLGTTEVVIDREPKEAEVYGAYITDKEGFAVWNMPAVVHVAMTGSDSIRAANPYTHDAIEVPKEYHHITSVNLIRPQESGAQQLFTYCDAHGNPYFATKGPENIGNMARIMSKYSKNFAVLSEAVTSLEQKLSEYSAAPDSYSERDILDTMQKVYVLLETYYKSLPGYSYRYEARDRGFSDIVGQEYDNLGSDIWGKAQILGKVYAEYVSNKVLSLLRFEDSSNESLETRAALESLIYIGFDKPRAAGYHGGLVKWGSSGTIYALKATGKGDRSGVSVIDPQGTKLAELPSNAQAFIVHTREDGTTSESFVIGDVLKTVSSTYEHGAPMLALHKDRSGNDFVSLVKDVKLQNSEVVVELSKFHDPIPIHVGTDYKRPIVPSKVKIQEDSMPIMPQDKPFAKRGKLVDDRGTDRESDDTYEAKVYLENRAIIEKLSTLQFYISEEMKDEHGKVTESPSFFIRDVAAGRVFQFPESITHLKLVKLGNHLTRSARLVPCTKDGDTQPPGMPRNMEGYTYIDAIFAYEKLTMDPIEKHAKLQLIDFSKYRDGELFKLQYNLDDPSVPRDANGNVIRFSNQQPHFTRVELIHERSNAKIGELSSAPAFLQGDVFLSFDTSYSHSDFISSLHGQEVEVEKDGRSDTYRVSLTGKNDLGTDTGYSDYYSFQHRAKKDDEEIRREVHERAGIPDRPNELPPVEDSPAVADPNMCDIKANPKHLGILKNNGMYFLVSEYDGTVEKDFFWLQNKKPFQFPKSITHLKVVEYAGKKHLLPSTAEGIENPAGMPTGLPDDWYIDPLLVHSEVSVGRNTLGRRTDISVVNLNEYAVGTLFEMRCEGTKSYEALRIREDRLGTRTVHLFDEQGVEIGILSKYSGRITHMDNVLLKVHNTFPTHKYYVEGPDSFVHVADDVLGERIPEGSKLAVPSGPVRAKAAPPEPEHLETGDRHFVATGTEDVYGDRRPEVSKFLHDTREGVSVLFRSDSQIEPPYQHQPSYSDYGAPI